MSAIRRMLEEKLARAVAEKRELAVSKASWAPFAAAKISAEGKSYAWS